MNCSFQKPHTGSGGPLACLPSLRLTLLPVRAPPALQPLCRASGVASGLGMDRTQPPALPMAPDWPLWALPRATLHVGLGVSRVPVLRPRSRLSCTFAVQPWPTRCPKGPLAPHLPGPWGSPPLQGRDWVQPRAPSGLSIFPARLSPAACLPPSAPASPSLWVFPAFWKTSLSSCCALSVSLASSSSPAPQPPLGLPSSARRASSRLWLCPQQPPRLGELTTPTSVSSRARGQASSSAAQPLLQPVLCKLYKERKEPTVFAQSNFQH